MLRFYAREDLIVHERDEKGQALPRPSRGAPGRYVGREYSAEKRGYPATASGYECPEKNVGEVAYLAQRCREGSLWAADSATAKAVGVEFVAVEFKDGVFALAVERQAKPKLKEAS